MRVLITGSTGFIGKELCKKLNQKNIFFKTLGRTKKNDIYIKNPADKNSDFYQKIFDKNKINKVIHLAAISCEKNVSWGQYKKINSEWAKNLYLALSKTTSKDKSFTFMSTVGVYGMPPHKVPCKENDKKYPNGKYHKSKSLAEDELIHINSKDVRLVIIRSSIVYSKNDPGSSLKKMYNMFKSNKYPLVRNSKRHFLNIDNLTSFCMISLEKGEGVYNTADLTPVSSEQLFNLFKKHSNGDKNEIPKWMLKILIKLIFIEKFRIKLGILYDWYYNINKSKKLYIPASTLKKLEKYLGDGSWQ